MKLDKNLKEQSVKAFVCHVDHPGVIKLLYLNTRTYDSTSRTPCVVEWRIVDEYDCI